MRRAAIALGALGAIGSAIACGVITLPPEPLAPVNECSSNASCATEFPDASLAPLCFGGSCVEGTSFRPILVATVPEGPTSTLPGFGDEEPAPASTGSRNGGTRKTGYQRETVIEAAMKSAARSVATSVGRAIVRGILGSLKR